LFPYKGVYGEPTHFPTWPSRIVILSNKWCITISCEPYLNQSYIIPIFKSGEQFNPMNYRGISLMNCLSKIFNSVINNRLLDIYENKI
jgi:hypothetical protein